jgi:hypothetical protein
MKRPFIEEAYRLAKDGAVANQLYRNPRMPQGDLKELWPKWIRSAIQFVGARRSILDDVPKIVLQPPF